LDCLSRMREMGAWMTKIVKIKIILRAPTPIQEAAGKELWHRLLRANRETHLNCRSGNTPPGTSAV
jgi:hypothetical protein